MDTHLDHSGEHSTDLITGVLADARDLAVAEIDKLKAEAINQVKGVGEEVKIASIGLLILAIAAAMFGTALSFGLIALGLPPWGAFGIIAVVFGVAGILFIKQRRTIAQATAD